ncbi:hypothetical protein Nepgr_018117 [Nepenthes gracilis]|uniref:GATA transcription factor n=1 Tax=Nepenthes gracilis TaxID=150966 RepID=A0AAD3XU05_NEPGR|nr:hypothetical protein Nepgr_018117 [Nepenthes gracilis]
MECIEARALKASFFSETAMKSSDPQFFGDDFLCVTGINGVLPGDDFPIDDFFDLPSQDFNDGSFFEEGNEEEKDSSSSELSSQDQMDDGRSDSFVFPAAAFSGSLVGDELSIPHDSMAELELWSLFMDDSVSDVSLAYPIGDGQGKTGLYGENRTGHASEPVLYRTSWITTAFPVRPRSKRTRVKRLQAWSLGSTLRTESSSSSPSSPAALGLFLTNPIQDVDSFYGEPAQKKQRKMAKVEAGGLMSQRRCTHCHVQKTPQWRTGPLGPKTLCNACGVRFNKGRLFPEYRPACSPYFSSEIHSNSHRKVLEIRSKNRVG